MCLTGFFPNEQGSCQSTTKIAGCVQYDSMDTCAKCDSNTILDYGKKECMPKTKELVVNLDFCFQQQLVLEAQCLWCDKFYYSSNGKCVKCQTFLNCAYCDPKDPTICLMCDSGFYQTAYKGTCVENAKSKKFVEFSEIQIKFVWGYLLVLLW